MKSKFSALIITSIVMVLSSCLPSGIMNTNIIKHNENSNPKKGLSFEEFKKLEKSINS